MKWDTCWCMYLGVMKYLNCIISSDCHGCNSMYFTVPEWVRRTMLHREKVASATREGLVDFPLEAANWLIHFKAQNLHILKKKDVSSILIIRIVNENII